MGVRFETLRRTRGTHETWWRYGASGLAAWSYLWGSTGFGDEALAVVEQLRTHGVAISHVDRLLPDPEAFSAIRHHVAALQARKAGEVVAARSRRGEVRQVSLTGDRPTVSIDDPVVRFLLDPPLAEVAGLFYRMTPRLLEAKVWQTVASDAAPSGTQRWHRDRPGDRHVLKCFVYLNEVRESSGPFCFCPGTQVGGSVVPRTAVVMDGKVERFDDGGVESELDVVRCVGPVGTVVFADTTGLHMGGRSVFGERLMITSQYGSAAAWQKPYFDVAGRPRDRPGRYALGMDRPPRVRHLRRDRVRRGAETKWTSEPIDAQECPQT